MRTLIRDISSFVTMKSDGRNFKSGRDMNDIHEIKNGAFLFSDIIEWTGTSIEASTLIASGDLKPDRIIHAKGKTILPGLVDSHTHIVFAGNRSNEFGRRLSGATYQEIAAEGGGIIATVKATRDAGSGQLFDNAYKLAVSAMNHGTTSMEIKSGYGLDLQTELKMLRVIAELKEALPLNIKATFLGAHDFPPEYQNNHEKYLDILCNEMLPAVAAENLADYCDAFVDKGYYTNEQGRKLFGKALDLGFKIRMHADELADVGAAALAAEVNALSADHLLFVNDENIKKLKTAGTVACLLPGTAYFLRIPYARARKMIDSGLIVAIASDCNPGTCFTENMQFILSLAAMNMHMTAEESLTAATLNAAHSIELSEITGSIESGKNADFIVSDVSDYTEIFYHAGINHIQETWIKGKKI